MIIVISILIGAGVAFNAAAIKEVEYRKRRKE